MTANSLSELTPGEEEVATAEVLSNDDVLVKVFALGPGAGIDPHEHPDCTNVFHLIEGSVTITQDGDREGVVAPAVIPNERGVTHGANNDADNVAILTATLAPHP